MPNPTLKKGSRGDAVKKLQIRLIEDGYPLGVDSRFGPATERAVIDFQFKKGLKVDGIVGDETWEAFAVKAAPAAPIKIVDFTGAVDERSERIIATLHPRLADPARRFVKEAAKQGITIKLISGLRTYAEQNALYAKGRTAPGSKVTNAKAGYSNHNFGLAFDIGVFQGSKYIEDGHQYDAVANIGKQLGFEWGGDWKSIVDKPHYELRPEWARGKAGSAILAELRRRKEAGIDYFA